MNRTMIDMGVYCSAALLALSVFLPVTSLPVVGEVSYHRIAEIEAYLVIALCFLAPAAILMNRGRLVVLSALGVWLTLLYPAIRQKLQADDNNFLSQVTEQATRMMQDFAADLFTNVLEFSWGGFVFLIALLAFTVFCLLRAIKK